LVPAIILQAVRGFRLAYPCLNQRRVKEIHTRDRGFDCLYSIRSTGADVYNNKKTGATKARVTAKSLPLTVFNLKISEALSDVKELWRCPA